MNSLKDYYCYSNVWRFFKTYLNCAAQHLKWIELVATNACRAMQSPTKKFKKQRIESFRYLLLLKCNQKIVLTQYLASKHIKMLSILFCRNKKKKNLLIFSGKSFSDQFNLLFRGNTLYATYLT